jgi:hypothetical protein
LGNPLTQAVASGVGSAFGIPEAGMILGQASKGLKTVKKLSDYARKGGDISHTIGSASGALSRGDIQGARSTIQKARDMGGVQEPMFV